MIAETYAPTSELSALSAADALAILHRHGIELHAAGARLAYRAPAGVYTPELRALVAAHRPALLALLRATPATPAAPTVAPVPTATPCTVPPIAPDSVGGSTGGAWGSAHTTTTVPATATAPAPSPLRWVRQLSTGAWNTRGEGLASCPANDESHLSAWEYHPAYHRLLCPICHPALFGMPAHARAAHGSPAGRAATPAPSPTALADARAALLAYGEAHGWPALPLARATSTADTVQARAPYLRIAAGRDGWTSFAGANGWDVLALALAAAGLAASSGAEGSASSGAEGSASSAGEDATPSGARPARGQERGQERGAQRASPSSRPGARAREASAPGVLDAGALWVGQADGFIRCITEGLPTPGACHAGELLALARREGLAQLWIHPEWHRAAGLPDQLATREEREQGTAHPFISDAVAAGWDIRSRKGLPATLAPWLHAYQPGTWGAIDLVCPLLWVNPLSGNAWNNTAWHMAANGRELLAALLTFADALGYGYRRSPGATGTGLLRYVHRGRTALDLSAYATPEAFPLPARRRGLALAHDIKWARPLTAEECGRPYLHGYDKNAMYLGACSSLALGFGPAEHLTGEGITCDGKAPGYWLASVHYDAPDALPHPFLPGGASPRYGAKAADAPRWYPTPALALARELGALVAIQEAHIWRESHRAMEPWYKAMRDARSQLTAQAASDPAGDLSAAGIARTALKAIYTQAIGWLDEKHLRKSTEAEDLYRPDWRHAIISQATANLWRQLARVYRETSAAPVAIGTDCAYFASDIADPIAACPAGLRLGAGLGEYKVKAGAVPLADVAPIFALLAEGMHPADVVKRLQSALKVPGDDIDESEE